MVARREKQVGKAVHKKKNEKKHGAPREQRRQWQVANGKSWSKRPQRRGDGWI
jgi:hypothetical protein